MKERLDLSDQKDFRFWRLLDAVIMEPEKASAMVRQDPSILESECLAGETPLHFFAVEGRNKEIELLRALGAKVPEFAIYHAIEGRHTSTVALLLELGGDPVRSMCERSIENPICELTREEKRLIRSYLDQYGYVA